jgi:hypothetical protein
MNPLEKDNAEVLVLEAEVKNLREILDIRIMALDTATSLAKESMERRLESMNEFRTQLKDQSFTFVTRREHDMVLADLQSLRESRSKMEGKADQSSVEWVKWMAILGILLSLFMAGIQAIKLQQIQDHSYGYQDFVRGKIEVAK